MQTCFSEWHQIIALVLMTENNHEMIYYTLVYECFQNKGQGRLHLLSTEYPGSRGSRSLHGQKTGDRDFVQATLRPNIQPHSQWQKVYQGLGTKLL